MKFWFTKIEFFLADVFAVRLKYYLVYGSLYVINGEDNSAQRAGQPADSAAVRPGMSFREQKPRQRARLYCCLSVLLN